MRNYNTNLKYFNQIKYIKEKLEFKDNEILEKRKKYRWNKMWFEHTKKRGRYENKTNEYASKLINITSTND